MVGKTISRYRVLEHLGTGIVFKAEDTRLGLFGTPEKDKQLRIYNGGHTIWFRNNVIRDELEFLDKYLGPAKQGRGGPRPIQQGPIRTRSALGP